MSTEIQPYVLRARKLSKSFDGHHILRDLSVELSPGEVVVLRGDNGSGKTTLLNVLSGFVIPDSGQLEIRSGRGELRAVFGRGRFRSCTRQVFGPERVAQFGCGRTWQDIRLFRSQTVEANVAVAGRTADASGMGWLINWRRGLRAENRNISQVGELLRKVGLTEFASTKADALSLGISKKVAIVRAVHSGATLLFLDEPISGLDEMGSTLVLNLLRELAGSPELTLVIVEHMLNLPLLLDFASTVWTLEDGQINVSEPRALRGEVKSLSSRDLGLPTFLAELPEVERTAFPGGGVLSVRRVHGTAPGDTALEVRELVVRRGERFVLGGLEGGIELSLRAGEIGLLVGPNGWGKTTLLDAVAGLIDETSGSIKINGVEMGAAPSWLRAQCGLCYLQARDFVFPRLNVEEQLQLAQVDGAGQLAGSLRGRRVANLSGGEKQRLGLRSVFARESSSLILLDEPFSALDETGLELLCSSMAQASVAKAILVAIPGLARGEQA